MKHITYTEYTLTRIQHIQYDTYDIHKYRTHTYKIYACTHITLYTHLVDRVQKVLLRHTLTTGAYGKHTRFRTHRP